MFEFLAGNVQFFGGETSGSREDWWASGANVVSNIVFNWIIVIVVDSSEFGKFEMNKPVWEKVRWV